MKKAEFKKLLIDELQKLNVEVDEKKVVSALNKTAIHMRNKYGCSDWSEEYNEGGVQNAVCFYHEYKQASTFNRDTYQSNR